MASAEPTPGPGAQAPDLRHPYASLQELYDRSPLHRWLGLEVRTDDGLTLRGTLDTVTAVDARRGIVHGGIVTSLLDIACTFALIEHTSRDWFTVDLRVDFLRFCRVGPIEVRGRAVHAGGGVARATAQLLGEHGQLCAVGSGTWVPMQ